MGRDLKEQVGSSVQFWKGLKGKTKDDAIKDAVNNYIKIWGNQKVTKYGEKKKTSGNLL